MFRCVFVFLIIALFAGLLGFTDMAGAASAIGQTLFFVFLALLFVAVLVILIRGGYRSDL